MTRQAQDTSVHVQIVVEAPIEQAFAVFTEGDISPRWQVETNLTRTSEVEVRFISETPHRTRLELDHRHLERHGEGWEQQRGALGSEGGWPGCLRTFAERLAA